MRERIYMILNRIYGVTMFVAFFGGVLPLIPFVAAIAIGGEGGERISIFLYNTYYPCVISLASLAVMIGLISMYIGKKSDLSTKAFKKSK